MTRSAHFAATLERHREIAEMSTMGSGLPSLRPRCVMAEIHPSQKKGLPSVRVSRATLQFAPLVRTDVERDRELALLFADLNEFFLNPEEWLETPNEFLGGYAPNAFLDTTANISYLRLLLEGTRYGFIA